MAAEYSIGNITNDTLTADVSPRDTFGDNFERTVKRRERSRWDQISNKGAVGENQMTPQTAMPYLFPGANPRDPAAQQAVTQLLLDPNVNEEVSAKHRAKLRNEFGDDLNTLLVAWNHGEEGAREWLKSGKNPAVLPDETRKYIGLGVNAKPGAAGWYVSPDAIDSEDKRSNTEVVNMSPEKYLGLLPPMEDDESGNTKRENLRKSLLSGDDIESIPSIEVKPARGNNLRIVDHDGRNRAQAAIDAGIETIPVAIRGVPQGRQFANLIGQEKVPYDFEKISNRVAPIPPVVPATPALPMHSPISIQPQQSPVIPPTTTPPIATPPIVVPPSKPDFYPEIAAGENKSLREPTSEPYRGLIPQSPADNLTASDRIAQANARSAGQVGFKPVNVLGNIASALNPIGSAEAAEAAPAVGGAPTPQYSIGDIEPGAPQQEPQYSVGNIYQPSQSPYVPDPREMIGAIGRSVINPIGNYITARAGYPLATTYGAAMGGVRGGLPGMSPASPEFQQARQEALNKLRLPETEVGRKFSAALNAPGEVLGWAAENMLKAFGAEGALPYVGAALDFAGLPGLHPRVQQALDRAGNALARPIAPTLERYMRTPEQVGAAEVNRMEPKELRAGGVSPAEIDTAMKDANSKGIPLAPIDFILPNEAQAKLVGQSLEASPEARGNFRKFLKERTEGITLSPAMEPIGGSLDRLDRHIGATFGTGSVRDLGNSIDRDISIRNDLLREAESDANKTRANIEAQREKLRKDNFDLDIRTMAGRKKINRIYAADPLLQRLEKDLAKKAAVEDSRRRKLEDSRSQKRGLAWGQSITAPSVKAEDISKFLSVADTPEQVRALHVGISDSLRDRLRRVKAPGEEVGTVDSPQNMRNKIVAALPESKVAEDFMRGIDYEGQIAASSRAGLRALGNESRDEALSGSRLRRAMESLGHLGAAFVIPGAHGHWPFYWTARAVRQFADYLAGGGRGVRGSTRGREAINALINPRATIAAGDRSLLAMPPTPPNRSALASLVPRSLPYAPLFSVPGSMSPSQGP